MSGYGSGGAPKIGKTSARSQNGGDFCHNSSGCLSSSGVEQLFCKQRVAGSNPV